MPSQPDLPATEAYTLPPQAPDRGATVLLFHGFTGTPWDMRPLAESLAARGYKVRVPRLPGHGTVPERFAKVRASDWRHAASAECEALAQEDRPLIVGGLSMGALLAMLAAAKFHSRVRALLLIAPIWRFYQTDARVLRALSFLPLVEWSGYWVDKNPEYEDREAAAQAPTMRRFPLARLRDLWHIQDAARDVLPWLQLPTLIVGARKDRVAHLGGVRELQARLPHATLHILERGHHIVPRDVDRATLATLVASFLDGVLGARSPAATAARAS